MKSSSLKYAMTQPPLIIEFTLPDAARDAFHADLKRISDNNDFKVYTDKNVTHDLMNNTHVGALLEDIARRHLPEDMRRAICALADKACEPVIVMRNLPLDEIIPATPKKSSDPIQKGIVSELALRAISALAAPPSPVDPQHSYSYSNVVGTKEDDAHLWHVDGMGYYPDQTVYESVLATPSHYDMLLCQRGVSNAPTCFAWTDMKRIKTQARPDMEGAQTVTLSEGDMVLFNNRRVMHGRDITRIKSKDEIDDRWMLGLSKLDVPPNRTSTHGAPAKISVDTLIRTPLGKLARLIHSAVQKVAASI